MGCGVERQGLSLRSLGVDVVDVSGEGVIVPRDVVNISVPRMTGPALSPTGRKKCIHYVQHGKTFK